jgi:hypothetical protein
VDGVSAAPGAHDLPATPGWVVHDLGRRDYASVWHAMRAFTDARGADTPDELWLVEHDPVFTLGQAGKAEHVLLPGDIPVVHVDRGGQVTYHGPGQIVAYPLLDLRALGIGVRELRRAASSRRSSTRWATMESSARAPRRRARRLRGRGQGRRAGPARAPRLHLPRPGLQHRDGPGAVPPHQPLRLCRGWR